MLNTEAQAAVPSIALFNYWFRPIRKDVFDVIDRNNHSVLGQYIDSANQFVPVSDNAQEITSDLSSDFTLFRQRLEYLLTVKADPKDMDDAQDLYEKRMAGAMFVRAYQTNPDISEDKVWKSVNALLDWLRTTDFFTCPASTRFHEAFPGGLVYHTLSVFNRAIDLMDADPFKSQVQLHSLVFCALVHDWCKIGRYDSYMKNVKNETTGDWEKVPAYRYNDGALVNLGHGVSSMFLAMKFVKLTMEECAAIRWHMSEYNCAENEMSELHYCNENYPLVLALQFADRLAVTKY